MTGKNFKLFFLKMRFKMKRLILSYFELFFEYTILKCFNFIFMLLRIQYIRNTSAIHSVSLIFIYGKRMHPYLHSICEFHMYGARGSLKEGKFSKIFLSSRCDLTSH